MRVRGTLRRKCLGHYDLVPATGEGSHYHESRFTIKIISDPYLSRLSCSLVLVPPPLLDLLLETTWTATTVVWEIDPELMTFVRFVGVGGPLKVLSKRIQLFKRSMVCPYRPVSIRVVLQSPIES